MQSFNLTSTYAYSQSSYYAYSQASYYAYSQSSYTSYTYSQSSYYAYSQSAYTGGTNVAPQGTAYLWHANTTATANTNKLAAAGLNDNNLTLDVNLNGGTAESGTAYEAGGVIWSTAQSIASVKFINGWESSGDKPLGGATAGPGLVGGDSGAGVGTVKPVGGDSNTGGGPLV